MLAASSRFAAITDVTLQGGRAIPGFGFAINGGAAINNHTGLTIADSTLGPRGAEGPGRVIRVARLLGPAFSAT